MKLIRWVILGVVLSLTITLVVQGEYWLANVSVTCFAIGWLLARLTA